MQKPYILVVEDEESLALLMRYNLEKEGFEVACVDDGIKAIDSVANRVPDLIILDWMLPEMNGIEVCSELRSQDNTKDIPIIMLTARSQEADRLKGFGSGADDYMTKPFSPKELVARIKSVLRRAKPSLVEAEVSYSSLRVDNNKKCIFAKGKRLDLSPLEFSLLHYMISKPERVHSRENLLYNVWGNDSEVETRTVDVCIRRLRTELQKAGSGLDGMIKTSRGEGYILEK